MTNTSWEKLLTVWLKVYDDWIPLMKVTVIWSENISRGRLDSSTGTFKVKRKGYMHIRLLREFLQPQITRMKPWKTTVTSLYVICPILKCVSVVEWSVDPQVKMLANSNPTVIRQNDCFVLFHNIAQVWQIATVNLQRVDCIYGYANCLAHQIDCWLTGILCTFFDDPELNFKISVLQTTRSLRWYFEYNNLDHIIWTVAFNLLNYWNVNIWWFAYFQIVATFFAEHV